MNFDRPLRGHCHCGRNRYIIQAPKNTSEVARVLFNSCPSHRVSQASPLAAHIRVPLDWYRSTTFAFFPDETSAMIRKVYTSPREQHTMRHFCGFCGTPLTYWSEEPRSEADYIQLTLGSLCSEDLGDLEDLGLLPEPDSAPQTPTDPAMAAPEEGQLAVHSGRETVGNIPWFETMVEGSRLGNLRTAKGSGQSRDGTVRVEWEIVEYTGDGGSDTPQSGKRKLDERDDDGGEPGAMEGVEGVQH